MYDDNSLFQFRNVGVGGTRRNRVSVTNAHRAVSNKSLEIQCHRLAETGSKALYVSKAKKSLHVRFVSLSRTFEMRHVNHSNVTRRERDKLERVRSPSGVFNKNKKSRLVKVKSHKSANGGAYDFSKYNKNCGRRLY